MNRLYQLFLLLTALLVADRAWAQTNAPTNLNVNVTYGGSICLQWTPNVAASTVYEIERSDDGRSGWNKVGDSQPVASGVGSAGNYCDENLPSSRTYYYRVRGNLGRNTYTNYAGPVPGTTKAAPSPPGAPTLTEVTANSIKATWNTQFSTTYELEMQTAGGGWQVISTQSSGRNSSLNHTISTLTGGVNYCFRVRVKDPQEGTSGYSNNACQTTQQAASNIRNFDAKANGSTNSIKLTWAGYGKESPIIIERSEDGGRTWSKLKDWLADSGEYTDTGLQAGKQYCYRIQESGHVVSEFKCDTTAQLVPEPPRNLRATVNSSQKITLNWDQSPSTFTTGYYIEVSDNQGGNYTRLDEVNGVGTTQYEHNGLTPSKQYCYRVKTKYNSTLSNPSNERCETTQAPPVTIPAPPTELTLQVVNDKQITLRWKDNSNNETNFAIERSTDGKRTWQRHKDVDRNTTSYDDGGLNASTEYCYRVFAYNTAGNSGATDELCATTSALPATPPAKPTNLKATAQSSTDIKLTWTDNSANETRFELQRSLTGNDPWENVDASIQANTQEKTDGGRNPSTRYYYRIRAVLVVGTNTLNSDWSDVANDITQAPPVITPQPPTGLQATAASSSQIDLKWTPTTSTFGSGYIIEQASPQGSAYKVIAEVNGLATSAFSVTGLTASTQYCFRLRTRYTTNSDVSNEACQTTQAPPVTLPRPPSNLKAEAQSSTVIRVTWDDNSDNEAKFEIWWATAQTAPFTKLTDVPANQREYMHTGLTASSQYCYQVRAVNSAGESPYAGPQCAITQAPPPTAPAAPSEFVANAASTSSINLSWKDNSPNETVFELQFSLTGNNPWTSLPSQTSNVTAFTHPGLTANTRYYYQLRAVNGVGPSAWVMANTITPALPLPSTNTDLKAEVADYDQIKLTWGAITNNPTGIDIERSTSPTSGFTSVTQLAGTSLTFTDTGLPELTTFYYRIRSTNVNGQSGNSNVANARTPESIIPVRPQPLPEGIYAHINHGTLFVTLNWNQFSEAKLRVVGLNGREQLADQCRINGGTLFQYDVAHLPGGIYVLCLDTDKNRYTKKIWIP